MTTKKSTRAAYLQFLEKRVPELHKAGYKGRTARLIADQEWAQRKVT